jgi:hypothetical protein
MEKRKTSKNIKQKKYQALLSRILACGTQSPKREVEKRRQSNM